MVEMALEDGEVLPQPSIEYQTTYSGKLTVRLSKMLHEHAAQRAKIEGVSLNAFLQEAIAMRTYSAPSCQIENVSKIMAQLTNVLNEALGTFNGVNSCIANINAGFVSLFNIHQKRREYNPQIRLECVNGGSYGVN